MKGKGCITAIKNGYPAALALFEIFVIDDEARKYLRPRPSSVLRVRRAGMGMAQLREDGARKVIRHDHGGRSHPRTRETNKFLPIMSYSMSDLLQLVVSEGAADLHLRVGSLPSSASTAFSPALKGRSSKSEDTEELMRSITSERPYPGVARKGRPDSGFAFGDLPRFRVRCQGKGQLRDSSCADPQ